MRLLISMLLGGMLALTGCTPSTGDPSAGDSPAASPTFSPPARPAVVRIPALQVTSNVIDLGLQPNGEMAVPPDAADTGWYVNSPIPGQPGPAVLAAHVNWKGVDGPFARLHELKAGDQVIVESADAAAVTFVVDRVETHAKDAFPHEAVYGDVERPELRLVTCTGQFDTTAHHYTDNLIVWAHLAS